jgi:hypothetical protein
MRREGRPAFGRPLGKPTWACGMNWMDGRRCVSCVSSPAAASIGFTGRRAGAWAWASCGEALGPPWGVEVGEGVGDDPILISDWYCQAEEGGRRS